MKSSYNVFIMYMLNESYQHNAVRNSLNITDYRHHKVISTYVRVINLMVQTNARNNSHLNFAINRKSIVFLER